MFEKEDLSQPSTVLTFKKDRILKSFRQVRFSDFTQLCELKLILNLMKTVFFSFQISLVIRLKWKQLNFTRSTSKKSQIILAAYSITSGTKKGVQGN
jgi:hypothetical protein